MRWKHWKKGIEKEAWQRKNWSCEEGMGKEKMRNKGSTEGIEKWGRCGKAMESGIPKGTKGEEGEKYKEVWVGKSLVSEEKN